MKIKIVEFRENRPFIVVVEDEKYGGYESYDFAWSKRYECYLYHGSSGGEATWTITEDEYWVSPDAQFDIYPGRGETRREQFDVSRLFEDNIEGETEYCSQCDDWILHDEPCIHLHWSDNDGWFVEIIYCCKNLETDYFLDFDINTQLIGEDDKCPYCGGIPQRTD